MGSASVQALRRENVDLKQLVAELSLEGYRLKQTAIPMPHDRYQRMSAVEKAEALVANTNSSSERASPGACFMSCARTA